MLQAEAKGIRFEVDYEYPVPRIILSDPLRLKQILINICNNAVKFTETGKVSVRVSCDLVKETMTFDVTDTGIGMTQGQAAKAFDAFNQADSTTTRKYGGTGLGLSLSKMLAQRLGGDIRLETTHGEGSRFSVVVKTGKIDKSTLTFSDLEVSTRDQVRTAHADVRLRGTVLLAEDTPDTQKLLSTYLRNFGATVTVCSNGEEAVAAATDAEYDLIFMDMQMPVMDGVSATSRLRAQGYKGSIFALTANAMREDEEACRRAGSNGFLTKPVDRNRLFEVMSIYLETAEAGKDLLADLREQRDDPERAAS
jgi:CheY-like chemotaxis protein/anti-sigma regulatory factor (Ser/Thr protein kinase)